MRFTGLLALALATPLAAQQQQGSATTVPARWDVSARRDAAKDFSFETTDGTWMSLDISPDGYVRTPFIKYYLKIYQIYKFLT
jgi:hypothetical protein